MQLRQPDLHALRQPGGRVEDEHSRAIEGHPGIARVERQLRRDQLTIELADERRMPGRGVALVLDRIPDGHDTGVKASQRLHSRMPGSLEVEPALLVRRIDEGQPAPLRRRQPGAQALEAVTGVYFDVR